MGNCFSIFHAPSCWDSLLTPWNELEGVAGEASGQGHPSHRDGGGAAKAPPPPMVVLQEEGGGGARGHSGAQVLPRISLRAHRAEGTHRAGMPMGLGCPRGWGAHGAGVPTGLGVPMELGCMRDVGRSRDWVSGPAGSVMAWRGSAFSRGQTRQAGRGDKQCGASCVY